MNDEFYFSSFHNGIKLIDDDKSIIQNPGHHTLSKIMQLPCSVYLLNLEGKTVKMNEEGTEICGFDSPNQAVGKSLFDVSKEENAKKLITNCNEVICAQQVRFFDELNIRKDHVTQQFFSIKSPCYGADNKIIGICGFSIVLGKHLLSETLSKITELGFLQPKKSEINQINGVILSQRELECLRLTIKRHTAKRIAQILDISYRTVEEYLTNIRVKTGIRSKAELIDVALAQGF